ncbi:hypothetical protein BDZ89DRAFT_1064292 [Hymenopellis radicata]|nr:hypothetical protein BDZ89DRAFT_1064292 [Hymenopellis radicata]
MSSTSAQPLGPGAAPSTFEAAPQETPSGELTLTVAALSVQQYAILPARIDTAADVQAALTTTPQLNPYPIPLLRGRVAEMCLYARAEQTRWLHDMAHDICDPVNRAGALWVRNISSDHWTQAGATDQLLPRYTNTAVRHNKSLTSLTGSGNDMRLAVAARDQRCWISGAPDGISTTNSHICPKRMGDAIASHIYTEFCGVPAHLSIYNPEFGILLFGLGLRRVGQNHVYEAHNFHLGVPIDQMSILALPLAMYPAVVLHGHQVYPPQPQTADPVPHPGLFRWHYMQCVLRRFGTDEYKALPNIKHHERPFRSEDDDDDQFDDDGSFDWPSAVFDRGRLEASVEAEQAEQRARVVRWRAV